MTLMDGITSHDNLGKSNKPDLLCVSHRVICVLGALITVFYLLICYLSFSGALQDMRRLEGLGFSYPFSYYLVTNEFPRAIKMSLPVTAEFMLYVIQHRRTGQKKSYRGSMLYFSILLILHTVIWLHANSLDFPESPPYITAEGVGFHYYIFANITMLLSTLYFIMYLLHMQKFQSKVDA